MYRSLLFQVQKKFTATAALSLILMVAHYRVSDRYAQLRRAQSVLPKTQQVITDKGLYPPLPLYLVLLGPLMS